MQEMCEKEMSVILKIDSNEVVHSDNMLRNNGKDWRYIVSYHAGRETFILLFINTTKNVFSYGLSQCDKNSAYKMSFNVSVVLEWWSNIETSGMSLSRSYLKIWQQNLYK